MDGLSLAKQVVAVLLWPFHTVASWIAPIPRVIKLLVATLVITAGIGVSAILGPQMSRPIHEMLETLELRAYHTAFYWRGAVPARSEIVIVGIDDESCDELGIWPWPRTFHAEVVRNLHAAGAKVIAFDVVFSEESPVEATELASEMLGDVLALIGAGRHQEAAAQAQAHMDRLTAMSLGLSPAAADQEFAQACQEAGNVILGAQVPFISRRLLAEDAILDRSTIYLPIPALEDAAFMNAVVDIEPNVLEGADRVYAYVARKELELSPETGEPVRQMVVYPGLAAATAGAYLGLTPDLIRERLLEGRLAGHQMVTSRALMDVDEETGAVQMYGEGMLINFAGPQAVTFNYVPYYQIRNDPARASVCRGKIVMIGAITRLLHDDWPTPFFREGRMPGVEVQANAVQTMLNGTYIGLAPAGMELTVLFGSCWLLGLLTLWLRPVRTLVFMVLAWVGLYYFELYLFREHRLWLRAVTPMIAGTVSFVVVSTLVYFTEEREKRQLRGVFQRYVGASVLDEIMERAGVEMGGEVRTVTMIFSDLRGFTTLSQDLSAQDVVALLRPYLTAMTDIVFAYQGTLDKFMGDGIMAYFGAPVDFEDHAEKAVLAAIDMQEELASMREEGRLQAPLYMRIGVHTGEAVVGDVGSATVSDYTVIGDPVNVSSRLEELNKKYNSQILISEETYRRVEHIVEAEYLGEEVVRGRDRPTGVYRLLGRKAGVRREEYMV